MPALSWILLFSIHLNVAREPRKKTEKEAFRFMRPDGELMKVSNINDYEANTRQNDVNKACPNPVLKISKNRVQEWGGVVLPPLPTPRSGGRRPFNTESPQ
jgi:hypothetical protein